jgi:hydroxyethylthiazole kinase-like uncharacterized protein yjeF
MSEASSSLYTRVLPADLYRADQVRELDRCAIEEHGIAGIHLMKRAGRAAFAALLERWPDPEQITVLCGAGNNGGDGYVIAALAAQRRLPVTLIYLADPEKLQGDARGAYEFARREGVIMQPLQESQGFSGVVVDAMLGTGITGEVREPFRQAIEWLNNSTAPVLAVDIPSGLCADTGNELGVAVKADVTVSFIGLKQGLLTGRGVGLTGELLFADLGVPAEVLRSQAPSAERLQLNRLLEQLPDRDGDAHKGKFGHVMVIGGDSGFAGAAAMAGEASARMGAGLTSVATRPEHVAAIIARRPELMVLGVTSGQELETYLGRPTVLVLGPGLGRTPWSEQMLQQAVASGLPMVLDADGLNLLAEGRIVADTQRGNWILTPHPGEAARLLDCTVAEIQRDRFAATTRLQQRYGGTVLLKGAGTVIAAPDGSLSVAYVGNPGMASGGMGDVLSGVIGGLLAQGLDPCVATKLAVCLHGTAADLAADENGQRGLLAMDLLPYLRQLLNSQLA